jgi:transposase
MPMLATLKKQFDVKRVVTVADKGLNSGDNIAFSITLGDGYIYSKSIRGASEDFKEWVLDESGYRKTETSKIKSKLVPDAEIQVSVEQVGNKAKKKKIKVEQKWIVFYSEKYAVRAKYKREETITKALKMIANPSKYKSTFDYGAAGYIKNLKIDKATGEISNIKETLLLDLQKIKEEEQYDGYYAIITSELDDSDENIINTYKGLWRIEESFKITKSVFKSRPIFLHIPEHINAHFLICFLALLIGRLVEKRLGGKHSIAEITRTLNKVSCTHLEQNIWIFDYANDFTDEINTVFNTDFGKKAMKLHEIKSNLAYTKGR